MKPDRRTFLRLLLASALAQTVDVEQLLWVPKPIIVVPELPEYWYSPNPPNLPNLGRMVAEAWEECIRGYPIDNLFDDYFTKELSK